MRPSRVLAVLAIFLCCAVVLNLVSNHPTAPHEIQQQHQQHQQHQATTRRRRAASSPAEAKTSLQKIAGPASPPGAPPDHVIPKLIHQTWKTKTLPRWARYAVHSWRRMNPGYKHRLYDDAEAADIVREHYPALWPFYQTQMRPVQRADVFRYVVVYAFGGVYADIDVTCVKPVDSWPAEQGEHGHRISAIVGFEAVNAKGKPRKKWLKYYQNEYQLCQWTFAAAPGSFLIEAVLRRIVRYYEAKEKQASSKGGAGGAAGAGRAGGEAADGKTPPSTPQQQKQKQEQERKSGKARDLEVLQSTGPGIWSDGIQDALREELGVTLGAGTLTARRLNDAGAHLAVPPPLPRSAAASAASAAAAAASAASSSAAPSSSSSAPSPPLASSDAGAGGGILLLPQRRFAFYSQDEWIEGVEGLFVRHEYHGSWKAGYEEEQQEVVWSTDGEDAAAIARGGRLWYDTTGSGGGGSGRRHHHARRRGGVYNDGDALHDWIMATPATCQGDRHRLCASVRPGGGRTHACLKEHRADLTTECNRDMQIEEEQQQQQQATARAAAAATAAAARERRTKTRGGGRSSARRRSSSGSFYRDPVVAGGGAEWNGRLAVPASCNGDRARFCGAVAPGEGRTHACLVKHATNVSKPCSDDLAAQGGS